MRRLWVTFSLFEILQNFENAFLPKNIRKKKCLLFHAFLHFFGPPRISPEIVSRFRVEAFLDSKFLEPFGEMRRRDANIGEMRRKPSELEDCQRNSEKCVERLLEVES